MRAGALNWLLKGKTSRQLWFLVLVPVPFDHLKLVLTHLQFSTFETLAWYILRFKVDYDGVKIRENERGLQLPVRVRE